MNAMIAALNWDGRATASNTSMAGTTVTGYRKTGNAATEISSIDPTMRIDDATTMMRRGCAFHEPLATWGSLGAAATLAEPSDGARRDRARIRVAARITRKRKSNHKRY